MTRFVADTRRDTKARSPRLSRVRRSPEARALIWLGPSLILILGVVVYPIVILVQTSLDRINLTGLDKGFVGFANFQKLFSQPDLVPVLWNTASWVAVSVTLIMVLGFFVAELLNQRFPFRKAIRLALLVPWAASVLMTAMGFRWIYSFYYGALNPVLQALHLISSPVDWLGTDATFFPSLVIVTVFVSVPFTTYVLLAGLQSIPGEVLEAAVIDGAGRTQVARFVTLPFLRPYIGLAAVLNAIWIFNSFPLVYILNKSNPGYSHDVALTYMYKLAFDTALDMGEAAAMSVVNVMILTVFVILYMRVLRPEDAEAA